jgi:hypothetical protein
VRIRAGVELVTVLLVVGAMSCSSEGNGSKGGTGGASGASGAIIGTGGSSFGGSGAGGSAGTVVGNGGTVIGNGGTVVGNGGSVVGNGGAAGMAGANGTVGIGGFGGLPPGACTPPPSPAPVADYGAHGPFAVTRTNNTGPSSQYTMFRPTDLDTGFKYPITAWGNGLSTTPDAYVELLTTVASHGFVVIASNSTGITAAQVGSGLDWLIAQNDAAGEFQGKLVVGCASAIGYSMGGGAVVTASGTHPMVKAIVSMHGLQATSAPNAAPLLLMTSTDDTFVTKASNVQPTYSRALAMQPAIMATLDCPAAGMTACLSIAGIAGHAIPLDNAHGDRAPLVAWLRYWIYGDPGAKVWFFGSDCTLCKPPWLDIQRKNYAW